MNDSRQRRGSGGGGGPSTVLRAMIKAAAILLAFQFCVVHVQILLMHFGGGEGVGETNDTSPERAAASAEERAASAAASIDVERAAAAEEEGIAPKKKPKKPKKAKKPKEPKKPKKEKPPKKPREPKPKPPPVVQKVEVIKEVRKSRMLETLTAEQAKLLDDEERRWHAEMDRLSRIAVTEQELAAGAEWEEEEEEEDPRSLLEEAERTSPLGADGVKLARYVASLDAKLAAADLNRRKLHGKVLPRAARTAQALREAADEYDEGAMGRMAKAEEAKEQRRHNVALRQGTTAKKIVRPSSRYVSDIDALLGARYLGNWTGEELGRRFENALRQAAELAEDPVPTGEEWVWDATTDLGVVFEMAGVTGGGAGECAADEMVRTDLPLLPHVPTEEELLLLSLELEGDEDDDEEKEDEEDDREEAEEEDDDDAARESDLFTLVGSIESVLRDRTGRYSVTDADPDRDESVGPLSTAEGENRFFDSLDAMAAETRDEVDALRTSHAEGDDAALATEGRKKSCVDEDRLEELVGGGLEALHRGKDLTKALEEMVRFMYDEDGKGWQRDLSLVAENDDDNNKEREEDFHRDAASRSGSGDGSGDLLTGGGASMDGAMLRRMSEDPLLARLLEGVDVAADAASGHVDAVDVVLDLIAGDDPDGSVGVTLGKAVRAGLGKVGEVGIPDAAREMREKAGILFDRV